MDDSAPLTVHALGAGALTARVEARRPISYHGLSGFAWRLDLRLADGRCVEALQVGTTRPVILDPRFRLA
jgi:hypothetical protein